NVSFFVKVTPDMKDKSGKVTEGTWAFLERFDCNPLAPKGATDKKSNQPIDAFEQTFDLKLPGTPAGIFGVKQVLTWETAAVRRIDNVTMGSSAPLESAHSHRTAIRP